MNVYLSKPQTINIMKTSLYSESSSDALDFDRLKKFAIDLLPTKDKVLGLYILTGIYTGLRYSDLSRLTYEEILKESNLILTEKKTTKLREIKINSELKAIVSSYAESGFIFTSNKGSIYAIQSLNRLLKERVQPLFPKKNISTHSLRKTFGNRVYTMSGKSPQSITLLCDVFNHSSESITKRYLGITKEEILNVYDII